MKIIILGYTSYLALAISNYFRSIKGIKLIYVGRKGSNLYKVVKFEVPEDINLLNISVSKLVHELQLDNDSVIINCITLGDLDKCELNQKECMLKNYYFVETLYSNLKLTNFKKIIHFSSNAVYDGSCPPYNENSKCEPINFYGYVKLKTDQFLLSQDDSRIVILRPTTLYGKVTNNKPNPVSMIISNLRNKRKMKLTNDLIVNLLYVEDLVKVVENILDIDFSGLLNVSGNKAYSRYELGIEIAKLLDLDDRLIEQITTAQYNDIAKRPLNTCFENKLMKELGVYPHSLEQMIHTFN